MLLLRWFFSISFSQKKIKITTRLCLRWKYFVQTVIPFFHFQYFFKHESRGFEVDESRERLLSIRTMKLRHLFITDFDTEYSSYFKISTKSSIAVRNKRKDGYVKIHRRLSRKLAFISHEPNLDTLPSSRRIFSIRSPFSLSLSWKTLPLYFLHRTKSRNLGSRDDRGIAVTLNRRPIKRSDSLPSRDRFQWRITKRVLERTLARIQAFTSC